MSSSRAREVKVVLLGDTGVGKSSLVLRFVQNSFKTFNESTIGCVFAPVHCRAFTVPPFPQHPYSPPPSSPFPSPTHRASFMSKMILVGGKSIKYQIWDTAGQEKYRSLAPMYYRGAAAAIIVYDITRQASFVRLKSWVQELESHGPENIVIAIAGNKNDLEESREVDQGDAEKYAAGIGAMFTETSAKTDTNVTKLFVDISGRLQADDGAADAMGSDAGGAVRAEQPAKAAAAGCC